MAVTKIIKIKRTTGKALNYIMNPEKTDEGFLVSGYAVEPEVADFEFDMTAMLARNAIGDYSGAGGSNIKAYHMIQSFSPEDHVTPEQAHEIGRQWASEILSGKHEFVIATHIDQQHIHNHVVFNATSCIDFKKFRTEPYKTVRRLREISDRLCAENGLHVLPPNLPRAEKNKKWQAAELPQGKRESLIVLLEEAIVGADTYEDFKKHLQSAGVRIKEGKHIAYLPPKGERFLRGHNIPGDYSKEAVIKKLERKKLLPTERTYAEYIDNLAKRVTIQDVQNLADTLRVIRKEDIQCYSDFATREGELQKLAQELHGQVDTLQEKNRQYNQAAKYLITYKDTLHGFIEYQNHGKRKVGKGAKEARTAEMHLQARKGLEAMKVNPSVDADKVLQLVEEQNAQVEQITNRAAALESRTAALLKAEKTVQDIMNQANRQQQNINRKEVGKDER